MQNGNYFNHSKTNSTLVVTNQDAVARQTGVFITCRRIRLHTRFLALLEAGGDVAIFIAFA